MAADRLAVPSLSSATSSNVSVALRTRKTIEFSKSMKFPGSSKSLSLLGAGVREKKFSTIPIDLYAIGFYIDQERLQNNMSLATDLVDGAFEKAMRITLAWNITSNLLSIALSDALLNRMRRNEDVLADFERFFKNYDLKKGTAIDFTWIQPGTLNIGISDANGMQPSCPNGTFHSRPLAAALFDVYLCKHDPVSPSLVKSIADGLRTI